MLTRVGESGTAGTHEERYMLSSSLYRARSAGVLSQLLPCARAWKSSLSMALSED